MPQPMTADQADAVYDLLVEHCGASDHPHSFARGDFVLRQEAGSTDEYRFMGALGFGGKFWNCNDRWYVTCYREDETPERLAAIDAANKALVELRATVRS